MIAAIMRVGFDINRTWTRIDLRTGLLSHPWSGSGSVSGARATSGSGSDSGTRPWSRSGNGPWRWSWSGARSQGWAASRSSK